ncbi:mannonate dehydratase [Pedobacter alluvionis]|uniref:Mannonate dehydratase n=1 Tax=Pedobacter alluvionis TaxID=475253 RepID=A0A497YAP6_9SPHI|nr:mannonate dehydratase [Pedobacter alluvionis]RLJ79557.1 D-mannonate dehydratase [Pedobacter alluvionis]TFB30896.1 mannonate dehydratase [Pedobacter alluvionis]
MKMIQTMRWYGPDDIVTLADILQAGCTGVVTALHHIAVGEIWPEEEILARKAIIESSGLTWEVVESLPVHEDIKKRQGLYQLWIENYKVSLKNLANCGIKVITYNFMPVLDWMRTDLKFKTHTGALALRFEKTAFIAFDLYLLNRPGATDDYTPQELEDAKSFFIKLNPQEQRTLMSNCLQGLPGSKDHFTKDQVLTLLEGYKNISAEILSNNLISFLQEITPTADQSELQLAIHPDDPPYPILGLPRIMSTEEHAHKILKAVPAPSNGICFCSGSFGARPDNDLKGMIERLGNKIHFLHLRSVQREDNGNFYEANHLEGSADMIVLVTAIVKLMRAEDRSIYMRPDHGHQMLDDLDKNPYPGYSAIGRLKGLAELRGLELGISETLKTENLHH